MTDHANDAEAIFLAALDKATPPERLAFMEGACAGRPDLLARVRELLDAHEQAQGPLDVPPPGLGGTLTAQAIEGPGAIIGQYKLLEQIGEGGFGVVYMAEQTQPVRRKVALKILKPGMDTRQVVARFEAERQALALMDHPHIAHVFDGGETVTGRPYFVMELVRGIPITDFCDQNLLLVGERLELFISVCQAVQHAHQKGVIHRDLKPTNVMITLHDGVPVPKVIDFGIAKAMGQQLTDKTLFTNYAVMIGTPIYMSPEQAEMSGLDVDTRTDIYALGVLLYELLTGTTPCDKERLKTAAYDEIRRMIREEEPARPSARMSTLGPAAATVSAHRKSDPRQLSQLFRGELDWIVMKALEKDRNRRYETANGLALDVQRYLADEPVHACPPSAAYRLRKLARRYKGTVLASALVLLALVVGIIGTTWGMLRATDAEAEAVMEATQKAEALEAKGVALAAAQKSERHATDQLFAALVNQARALRSSGRVGQRFEALKAIREAAKIKITPELRDEAVAALVLPDVEVAREWQGHTEDTTEWTCDAKFERYARINKRGEITVCRLTDAGEEVIFQIPRQAGDGRSSWGLRMSPDGRFLVHGHNSPKQSIAGHVRVWKLDGPAPMIHFDEPQGLFLFALAFDPAGRRLALGHPNGTVSVYDLERGIRIRRLSLGQTANALAFDPHGNRLAAACVGAIRLFDTATGHELPPLRDAKVDTWTYSLAWHPAGRLLVGLTRFHKIHVWDIDASSQVMPALAGYASSLMFNARGDRLIGYDWGGMLRVWDFGTGRVLLTMPGRFESSGETQPIQLNRDGTLLGVERSGTKVRLWRLADGRELWTIRRVGADAAETLVAPVPGADDRIVAAASNRGLGFFDLENGKELAFLRFDNENLMRPRRLDPSHGWLTSGNRWAIHWPARWDAARSTLYVGPPHTLCSTTDTGMDASLDGRIRAFPQGGRTRVLDRDRPGWFADLGPQQDVRSCAVSPEGRWIATCTWHADPTVLAPGVRLWEIQEDRARHVADLPVEAGASAGFSPNGRWLVTTSFGQGSQLWEVGTWRAVRRFKTNACWSLDGQLLATHDRMGEIVFVEPESGKEVVRLTGPQEGHYYAACMTADGTRVISWLNDGTAGLQVWDLRLIRRQLQELGMDWDVPQFVPAPASGSSRAPPAVKIDPGFLRQRMFDNDRQAVAAFSRLLEVQSINPEAYLQRGLAYGRLNESANAVADYEWYLALTAKSDPRRSEVHFRRASMYHQYLKDDKKTIVALLDAADSTPELMPWPDQYARLCNHYAWLAVKPSSLAGTPQTVLRLARKAVELEPHSFMYQNTLGVALYRLGRYEEAVRCLEANVPRSEKYVAFDLYFLAMCHQRLGQRDEAGAAFEGANASFAAETGLAPGHRQELAGFRAEAEAVLGISSKKK